MRVASVAAPLCAIACLLLPSSTARAVVIAEFDFESADGPVVPNQGVGADGILAANAMVVDGVLDLDNMALEDPMDAHGMSIPLGLDNPFGGGADWRVSFDFSTEDAPGESPGALFSSDGALEIDGEFNNEEQRGSLNIFMSGEGAILVDGWWIGAIEGGADLNDGETHNVAVSYTAEEALWELYINEELVAEEGGGEWEYLRDASLDRVRVGGVSNPDFGFEIDADADAFDVTIDNLVIEGTPSPDLNMDRAIDVLDWDLFKEGFGSDLEGLTDLEAFLKADLNTDGVHNARDFTIFATAFDAANGAGAMAALTAGVPEPAGLGLLSCAIAVALALRKRRARPFLKASSVAALVGITGLLLAPGQRAEAQVLVEYLFESGGVEEFEDTSGNNRDGSGFFFEDQNVDGSVAFHGEQEISVPLGDANPFDGSRDFSMEFDFSVGFHEEDEAGHLLFSSANADDPAAGVEHSMSLFVDGGGDIVYDNFFVGEVRITPPEFIIDDGESHNLLVTFQAPEDLGENPDEPNPGFMMMRLDNVWYEGDEIAPNILGIDNHEVLIGASLNEDFPYECEGLECAVRNFLGELSTFRVYDEAFVPTDVSAVVDRATGDLQLLGGEFGRDIQYYEVNSEEGAVNAAAWAAGNLGSQNVDAIGEGSGQSWEALTGDDNRVVEAFLMGSTLLDDDTTLTLPGFWNGAAEDLQLELVTTDNQSLFIDIAYLGEGSGNPGGVCDPNTMGDLDGSGMVDFADFLVLSNSFGQEVASHAEGDIDCSGAVDFGDFLVLSNNFGQAVGAETASVPEPASWVLLLFGTMLGWLRRRSS